MQSQKVRFAARAAALLLSVSGCQIEPPGSTADGSVALPDASVPPADAAPPGPVDATVVIPGVDGAVPERDAAVLPPAPGDAGTSADAGPVATPGSALPPVTTTDGPGPFSAITKKKNIPGIGGWIVYPTELGKNGLKHPLFLWGPGGGTGPQNYEDKGHYDRWASHGFVIYSPDSSSGNGTEMKAGLDYLIKQNETPGSDLYQKLDTSKVAAAGHSMGSITTFAWADDPRITTTIHVAGGSFDGQGPSKLRHPTAYICGGGDTSATPNAERDYEGTTVPVFMTVMDGVSHIEAARMGWPAIIAWLRWHLAGEVDRRAQFIGPNCEFCTGKWKSKSKNW